MSFIEGFAAGFTPSFNRERQATLAKENDAFNHMMKQFSRNQELRTKTEEEDRKLITQAQELTRAAGAPEGAWSHAYHMLKAGMSGTYVMDAMKKSQFTPTEVEAGQVNPETNPMDVMEEEAQQKQTGPSPLQEPAQTPDVATDPNVQGIGPRQGGLRGFIQRMRERQGNRIQDNAMKEVAATLGISEEELKDTLAYEGTQTAQVPDEVARAPQFEREYSQVSAQGEIAPLVRGSEDWIAVSKEFTSLSKAINTERIPAASSVDLFKSFVRNVGDMATIVEQGGDKILNEPITWLAKWAATGAATARSIADVFGSEDTDAAVLQELSKFGPNSTPQQIAQAEGIAGPRMNALQQRITDLEQSNGTLATLEDVNQASTLMEMKTKLLAYQLGMMYMQTGRAFSEGERKMMVEITQGGTTVDKFYQNISNLVFSEGQRLSDTINRNNANLASSYETINTYGQLLGHTNIPTPIDFSGDIQKDQAVVDILQKLSPHNNLEVGNQASSVREEVQQEEDAGRYVFEFETTQGLKVYTDTKTGQQVVR